ncbi:ABC transporter ATP-binding protein [Geovibrio ferrireducens]|uniref:ABC transporter ATP-binding protein n=1 Tax=Geovibrio ferrireducens TaxID=46201 RepID=UPI002247E99D|nr:ABC transporter ATP-binding protein [Geovibrio ferrireducens]
MILKIENLHKSYKNVKAVDGVSFHIRKGEIFGLLGPNGAGKTTVIKMISTLTRPDSGSIEVNGCDVMGDRRGVRQSVAVVPQENNLEGELTVYDNLRVYAALRRVPCSRSAITDVMEHFGIISKKNEPVDKLSGGQKRRVIIARVMLADPELILLDEPTLGLDPSIRREIWNLIAQIKSRGKSILLTTHYTEEAENLCDRVAIMSAGKIKRMGTPEELISETGRYVLETSGSDGCRIFRIVRSRDELDAAVRENGTAGYTVRDARLEDVVVSEGGINEHGV